MSRLRGAALPWAFSLALCALLFAPAARADVSSWIYTGLGPGFLDGPDERTRTSLQIETGFGSPPASLVFGGLFRMHTFFNEGSDLALLVRGATRGFVQGGFGLALDAGAYERFWGQHSAGGLASLGLGAPWGVTLSATYGMGTHEQRFAAVTLGIDFARLTVYRTTGTSWFVNPFVTDERGRGPALHDR